MLFEKGVSGNIHGKPKGTLSKISRIRSTIMGVFEANKEAFEEALKEECKRDPTRFYRTYIVPFMPKNVNLTTDINPIFQLTHDEMLARFEEMKRCEANTITLDQSNSLNSPIDQV